MPSENPLQPILPQNVMKKSFIYSLSTGRPGSGLRRQLAVMNVNYGRIIRCWLLEFPITIGLRQFTPIGRRPLAKAWPTVLRFNGPNPAGHPEASHRDRCGQHPDHTKVAQWLVCATREQHATNCGSEAACQMLYS
jgi:hypothetical protein